MGTYATLYGNPLSFRRCFDTEDQRNWSITSYKTYCTPLEISSSCLLQEG
jgi:hypothetical protein